MRKFFLFYIFAYFCLTPALGQTGNGYRFDNFDTRDGVTIVEEQKPLQKQLLQRSKNAPKASFETGNKGLRLKLVSFKWMPEHHDSSSTDKNLLSGFSTGDINIDKFITESGERNGVDPRLLYAIMHQESTFKKRALSPKGARGLMQLMPPTAARFGVRNIFDPKENIEGGAKYVRFLLNMFEGDVELALAGYNAGEGAVLKYGRRVPPYRETQNYVRRITQRYSVMTDPKAPKKIQTKTSEEVATLKDADRSIYEPDVYIVRLPDGSLQLVSQ
jgi:hypothetical protein